MGTKEFCELSAFFSYGALSVSVSVFFVFSFFPVYFRRVFCRHSFVSPGWVVDAAGGT